MSLGRLLSLAGAFALLFGLEAAARAATAENLYQAQTIVTGQSEENRGPGFARCLVDVLVKVSGDPRLLEDARVDALAQRAASFVHAYRYRDRMEGIPVHDEQGTRDRPYFLTVAFVPQRIDEALRVLGREAWTAPRPRVLVLLAVRNGAAAYLLSDDGRSGPGQREALLAAADKVGVPAALPAQAALAQEGLTFERVSAATLSELDAAAKRIGGDVVLAGTMIFSDAAQGWTADWRLPAQGQAHAWRIRGVNFDEAFRTGMRGAAQILSGHGAPGAPPAR